MSVPRQPTDAETALEGGQQKPQSLGRWTFVRANLGTGLRLTIAVLLGSGAGLGGYTLVYAKGGSYFSNDPTACANCHIMQSHLDAWSKSSHRAVAGCNDCHLPTHGLGKLFVKAKNGLNHSWAFTTGRFHEPIEMTPANRSVTEHACRACHQEIVHMIEAVDEEGERLSCIRCHSQVGHPR